MPKGTNQKFKLYYLAKIMMERTDTDHYITMPEIMRELGKYEVTADRKSIYNDLRDLERFGIEIEGEQVGKGYHYTVIRHQFDLPELKLLVDVIQSSKFITERKSNELIRKMEAFASEHEAKQLQRQVYVSGRIKAENESIYYNVDEIHRAIAENRKIRFQYFQWNVKKEAELRHDGAFYHISPWHLLWDDENYYLVGYDTDAGKMKHYRVDKMKHISMTDEARDGREEDDGLDMASYSKKSFGMFGGVEQTVKLRMKNEMAGVIIDRFGKDVMMIPSKEAGYFHVNVDVQVSDQFLSWIFALGDGAKIMGPENVLEKVRAYIERLNRQYL